MKPRRSIVLAIDWDHTIIQNEAIQPGERYPPLYEGAKEAILVMKERGYKVIIHTCNNPVWIKECLEHWDIPFDSIWTEAGKPVCSLYIDDLGLHFQGNWTETLVEVEERLSK